MIITNITTSFDRKKSFSKFKGPIEANTFASFSIEPNADINQEFEKAFNDNVRDSNKILQEEIAIKKEEKQKLESYVSKILESNPYI